MNKQEFSLYLIIWLFGIIIGIILSYIMIIILIQMAGDSFKIEHINTTISLNQSMIIDAINKTRRM